MQIDDKYKKVTKKAMKNWPDYLPFSYLDVLTKNLFHHVWYFKGKDKKFYILEFYHGGRGEYAEVSRDFIEDIMKRRKDGWII